MPRGNLANEFVGEGATSFSPVERCGRDSLADGMLRAAKYQGDEVRRLIGASSGVDQAGVQF